VFRIRLFESVLNIIAALTVFVAAVIPFIPATFWGRFVSCCLIGAVLAGWVWFMRHREIQRLPQYAALLLLVLLTTYTLYGAYRHIVSPEPQFCDAAAESSVVLRAHGSNTVNAKLGPILFRDYLVREKHATSVSTCMRGDKDIIVSGELPSGKRIGIEIQAFGSKTGFSDLAHHKTDIAMSSIGVRQYQNSIKSDAMEVAELASLGDLTQPASEHVLGIDAVGIIVGSDHHQLREMSVDEIAGLLAGNNWEAFQFLPAGPVHVCARDPESGTGQLIHDAVLEPRGLKLSPAAELFAGHEDVVNCVMAHPGSIGYVGLPFLKGQTVVCVRSGAVPCSTPTRGAVALEQYSLTRRLYAYTRDLKDTETAGFIGFAESARGQELTNEEFVGMTVPATCDEIYRLALRFRTGEGEVDRQQFDSKGNADFRRVIERLKQPRFANEKAMVFAYTDNQGSDRPGGIEHNVTLSYQRSRFVADLLRQEGIHPFLFGGFGDQEPLRDNATEEGRALNRRAEIWLSCAK
jgi:phosphate transport system substrate-binding protein